MVVIPPHRRHRAVVHNHAQAYRRFVFWVSREYASRLMELSPAYGYLMQRAEVSGKNVFHSDVITFNATQFKIFQLIEEMQMERFGREARIPLLVNDLILHLNRMVYEEENPAKVKEQDLYQNLIYYIEEHLEEELSLEKLAGAFFVSRYYVAHVFKEQAGISVHQYILKKRMQASREAILGGENISQVYERFGFRDYSSFLPRVPPGIWHVAEGVPRRAPAVAADRKMGHAQGGFHGACRGEVIFTGIYNRQSHSGAKQRGGV